MDDNGFDICQCLWNHNMAMRRLLSFLRQSQAYCTDTECLTELPGSNIESSEDSFIVTVYWLLFAMSVFFLGLNTFRSHRQDVLKLRDNENNSRDNSSPPPPLC